MNLLDIRTKFVQLSGRYDLVDDPVNWSDNGADFYINSGQNYLDRLVTVPENTATIFLPLASGEYSLMFQHSCRSIKTVFANNTEDRIELEKVSLQELKTKYAETVGETDTDAPAYYALADLRALETTVKNDLGTFINLTHDETNAKYDYRGLIIVPPVDEAYTIEISGLFLQNKLTSDTDENYWTQAAPDLLLKASLYQLEAFSRGTENAKNWLSAILSEVHELEKDFIEEDVATVDTMKG